MLERAVGMDPSYAPAWGYLGVRYHYDGAYSNGGAKMFRRSDAALERALALDPNLIGANAWLITNWVERNDLVKAYQSAKALVARHPESEAAHFALSYVDRYGGAIEESAHECDTARALDPGNFTLRSCAFTFEQLGNYDRAMEYLQLDAGSGWARSNIVRQYIRAGNVAQAREVAQKIGTPFSEMIMACAENPASERSVKAVREQAEEALADPDAEVHYIVASDYLFCQREDLALNLLKTSVDGHYCAYSGLQNDSLWASLRGTQDFTALLASAKKCQDDFLAARDRVQQGSTQRLDNTSIPGTLASTSSAVTKVRPNTLAVAAIKPSAGSLWGMFSEDIARATSKVSGASRIFNRPRLSLIQLTASGINFTRPLS